MKIEFYRHNIGSAEIRDVTRALGGVILTTGKLVSQFEEGFSSYLDCRYTVGLASCTAALHLSLLACGVAPGDEVITTPMTFIATANAVLHAGARPVFVDVEPATGNIDAGLIEGAITRKTRAILPVHLYGSMCDMRTIRAIARKHGLKVIEDCAHCIEGERDGIRPAAASDAACFSFYATKSITCGEGGAVATNNKAVAETVKCLSLHGMTKGAHDRYSKKYRHWDMDILGWKYNMDNIKASLLLNQTKHLQDYWKRRKEIYDLYVEGLRDVPGLGMPAVYGASGLHLFTVWVDPARRDRMVHRLQEKGVGVAVNYQAVHTLRFYREKFGFKSSDFPAADRIGASTISLPFYPKLTVREAAYVIRTVRMLCKQ